MRGINKVILVGTLGADPETKYFPNGGASTKISLATNCAYEQNGEAIEETEWHHVFFSGKMAETAARYLRKASKVYVEGRIKKVKNQDGSWYFKILAYDLQMLGPGPNSGEQSKPYKPKEQATFDEFDDDIPF